MTLTNNTRTLIANGLRAKDMTQTEFAEKCGKKKAWASKLFSGKLVTLSDEVTDRIEEVLEIQLMTVVETHGRLAQNALDFAKAMDEDQRVADIANLILDLRNNPKPAKPARRSQTGIGALLLLAGACVGLLLGGLRSEPVVVQAPAADVKSELLELRAMVAALEVRGSAVASRTSAPATRSAKVQP